MFFLSKLHRLKSAMSEIGAGSFLRRTTSFWSCDASQGGRSGSGDASCDDESKGSSSSVIGMSRTVDTLRAGVEGGRESIDYCNNNYHDCRISI